MMIAPVGYVLPRDSAQKLVSKTQIVMTGFALMGNARPAATQMMTA